MITNKTKWLLAGLLCMAFWPMHAVAAQADFDEGQAALERGDYATALRQVRPLAEAGHANAQNALGSMYYHGQGVVRDYAEAAKWYRIAAEQYFVAAQISLGLMYEEGQGLPQDYREAVTWYRKAVNTILIRITQISIQIWGDWAPGSCDNLGYGESDVPVLPVLRSWRIDSVETFLVETYKWFDILEPVMPGGHDRDVIDKSRDRITEKMTHNQIAKARRLARKWMETRRGN